MVVLARAHSSLAHIMNCEIERMERRLRHLEHLQNNMSTTTRSEAGGVLVAPPEAEPRVQTTGIETQRIEGLPEHDALLDSFAGKLKMSRDLTGGDRSPLSLSQGPSRGSSSVSSSSAAEDSWGDQPIQEMSDSSVGGSRKDVNEALHNLRSILDEQKKRHILKRKRLAEIKEANAVAERGLVVPESVRRSFRADDVSAITDPSFLESKDSMDSSSFGGCWKDDTSSSTIEEEEEALDSSSSTSSKEEEENGAAYSKSDGLTVTTVALSETSSHPRSKASAHSPSFEEMKLRVKALEDEKSERAQALVSFLVNCSNEGLEKTNRQKEEEYLSDGNQRDSEQTRCSEMGTLLVEQRQHSEYLRGRLTSLEKRATSSPWRIFIAIFSLVFLWACTTGLVVLGVQQHQQLILSHLPTELSLAIQTGTFWNGVCAPAQPGTKLREGMGPMEAPWWAPEVGGSTIKTPLFYLAGCGSRPRTRLEMAGGMLRITQASRHHHNRGRKDVVKKPSKAVYVETGTIHIVDQYGSHVEMEAPWVLN